MEIDDSSICYSIRSTYEFIRLIIIDILYSQLLFVVVADDVAVVVVPMQYNPYTFSNDFLSVTWSLTLFLL
jgi:hypothetical protein